MPGVPSVADTTRRRRVRGRVMREAGAGFRPAEGGSNLDTEGPERCEACEHSDIPGLREVGDRVMEVLLTYTDSAIFVGEFEGRWG